MFDVVEFFCRYCQYNNHVDTDEVNKDKVFCKNCGRVIHENTQDGFDDSSSDLTEQERLSDVIRKRNKDGTNRQD